MTEKRLKSIMDEIAIDEGYTNWEEMYQKSFIFPERVVKVMKQAVNEAIQECADKATTRMVVGKTKPFKVIDRDSILNLKVK